MTEETEPEKLPTRLLADQKMIAACRERDFSTVFQLVKRVAGIYPSRIARRCDMTPSRVGEVMSGQRKLTNIDVIERVADGLRIPGRMLGLDARPWESRDSGGANATEAQSRHSSGLPAQLPRPLETPDLWEHASDDALVDPEFFTEHIRALLPEHYKTANLFGARHTLDTVTHHARLIEHMQLQATGMNRETMLTIGARVAEFLGWLTRTWATLPARRTGQTGPWNGLRKPGTTSWPPTCSSERAIRPPRDAARNKP